MTQPKVLDSIKRTLAANMPKGGQAFLYGSRARGDNRSDSDWDILLLVNRQEDDPIGGVSYQLMQLGWDLDEEISPITYTKDEWRKYSFTPFYHNVTNEGIQIYGA